MLKTLRHEHTRVAAVLPVSRQSSTTSTMENREVTSVQDTLLSYECTKPAHIPMNLLKSPLCDHHVILIYMSCDETTSPPHLCRTCDYTQIFTRDICLYQHLSGMECRIRCWGFLGVTSYQYSDRHICAPLTVRARRNSAWVS
jgi:hypothetical protein